MNLVGHREAGKTSLATRLTGKEFEKEVQSTEGVAIHHIKSKIHKFYLRDSAWEEETLDPDELFKSFSHAILSLSMTSHQDDKPSEGTEEKEMKNEKGMRKEGMKEEEPDIHEGDKIVERFP